MTFGDFKHITQVLLKALSFSLLYLVIFPLSLMSQDIESLHLKLSQQTDDKLKVPILLELGNQYKKEKAYIKALDYYEQCLTVGKTTININDQISINQNIAIVSELIDKNRKAINAYNTILSLKARSGDTTNQFSIHKKLGELLTKAGAVDDALKQYESIIDKYQAESNEASFVNIYNNIGFLYHQKNQVKLSLFYYLKALELTKQNTGQLKKEDYTVLYLNIGTNYSALKDYSNAQKFFKKAHEIEKDNPVKTAEIKTYIASNYILIRNSSQAIAELENAIELTRDLEENASAERVLLKSYQLIAKVYEGKDSKSFNHYTQLYQKLIEKINNREHLSQKSNFDNQIVIEKNENKLLSIIADKEKAEKRNIQLEKTAQEKQLDLLKREQELHQAELRNNSLEKKSLTQILNTAKQQLEVEDQTRKAIQNQLLAEKVKAENAKQQKELLAVSKEKELQAQQLQQAKTETKLWLSVFILVLLLFLVSIVLFAHSHKHRKVLAEQNKFIQKQHHEIELKNVQITNQNAELTQKQEEILLQSNWLLSKNQELYNAHLIIEQQNEQLKLYTETLEIQVQERTHQLTEANQELVKNNQQLEQYSYIVAHNLRGPVARLLGLSQIFNMDTTDLAEKEYCISKVQQEIMSLDGIITDLNTILQIKRGMENEVEIIKLDQKLKTVLTNVRADIEESGTQIISDFSEANEVRFIHAYLHSILYNLISNAIKYRSSNRKPVIEFSTTIDREGLVCLKVKDNGLGMDLERHGNNVFGLYKRFHFHKEGKGLGLYLVKTQIEMLGGKIAIESQKDVGTTFYLYFAKSNILDNTPIEGI
jgi:signal transduction histidine kinase/tetratricopeptide (TPR) repeat protein